MILTNGQEKAPYPGKLSAMLDYVDEEESDWREPVIIIKFTDKDNNYEFTLSIPEIQPYCYIDNTKQKEDSVEVDKMCGYYYGKIERLVKVLLKWDKAVYEIIVAIDDFLIA